jgi:hypothetical protein
LVPTDCPTKNVYPLGQLAQIAIGVAFGAAAPLHLHGDALGVQFRGRVEQFDQVAVRVHALGFRRVGFVELGQDPLLQTREVDVNEVVVPIDGLGRPWHQLAFFRRQAVAQRSDVVRA